jgi:3-methyladenine DNA glycosylase AlkD
MNRNTILKKLKSLSDPKAIEGMARFGINPNNTIGVSIPKLRSIAKDIGCRHQLANQLWKTGIHEARILASMIADPSQLTDQQMEAWVTDFDSWDVCDQCCMNLFRKCDVAWSKAEIWSQRNEEFIRRAGFVLMATLAVHAKQAEDTEFEIFFTLIQKASND